MNVSLIKRQGGAAVIQWAAGGQVQRAVIPAAELVNLGGGQFECQAPELGAPYGLPWAELIQLTVTPEQAEQAFHNYGLWTAQDIQRNHLQALGALQSLYAGDLGALIKATRTRNGSSPATGQDQGD